MQISIKSHMMFGMLIQRLLKHWYSGLAKEGVILPKDLAPTVQAFLKLKESASF